MEELVVWETLNTCYNRPEKFIAEALDPIINFSRYKVFKLDAIREFFFLLRAAMINARGVQLLPELINKLTLPDIMNQTPHGDWKQ